MAYTVHMALRAASVSALLVLLMVPFFAFAAPFGGRASIVHFCYNKTIFTLLGPPRGGQFIWHPGTKTYQFGPPSHAGQWMLGLSGGPYYCLWSVQPIRTVPGLSIIMMGSSR